MWEFGFLRFSVLETILNKGSVRPVMGDSAVFGFGVFVVIIFLAGVAFTIKEFQNIDDSKQRNYKNRGMDIKKKSK